MKLIIILMFVFGLISCKSDTTAQSNEAHILNSFPDWRTDFSKSSIDLKELKSGGPPKDGIPAIVNPKFVSFNKAEDWLDEKEPVIALEIDGKAKAYPLQILIWHEIINDELSGVPVIVTFCPLCYSAIVFDRRIGGMMHTFGVSGLLRNSDMVMYDQATESFWQQLTGEAIVGKLAGKELRMIPSQIISFNQFKESYSEGKILSRETGFSRNYGSNPYAGYDDVDQSPFLFDGPEDKRLKPNEKVVAVKGEIPKAYPYSITKKKKVINDELDGKPIVIFHTEGAVSALDESKIRDSKESGSTGVFSRKTGDKTLTFIYDKKIKDKETGSVWSVTGKAVEGVMKGTQLKKEKFGDYFSFAWFAFRPNTEIYETVMSDE